MSRSVVILSICFLVMLPVASLIAQWVPTNGPSSSQVSALAMTPPSVAGDRTRLFAATLDGGVLVSPDSGATWREMNNGLTNRSVRALAFMHSSVFAGTAGSGIFRSSDFGATWTAINAGLVNVDIFSLCVRGDTLFTGTSEGGVFFLAAVSGRWTEVSIGSAVGFVQSLVFDSPLTPGGSPPLLAGTSAGGVFRSTSFGSSWSAMDAGLDGLQVRALASVYSIGDSGGSILFAGTEKGLFRSDDHAATWHRTEAGLTTRSIRSLIEEGSYLLAGADSGQIAFSANKGSSWVPVPEGLPATDNITSLVLTPPSKNRDLPAIFAGTSGGRVFRAFGAGTSWAPMLLSPLISALAFKDSMLFVGNALGKTYRSDDGGTNWTDISNGLAGGSVHAFASNGSQLFAGTNHGLFRSDDNGELWSDVSSNLTSVDINALAFSGTILLAGTAGGGIFRTLDSGASWNAVNAGLGSTNVTCVISVGTRLFAGTNTTGVYMSADSGGSWISLGPQYGSVHALAANDHFVFAGLTNSGVFRYTFKGGSASHGQAGLTNPYILALAVGHAVDSPAARSLFAGTEGGGIFQSTDDGQSWTSLGPADGSISALTLFPDSDVDDTRSLVAGIQGTGVCISAASTLVWDALYTSLWGNSVPALSYRTGHLLAGTSGNGVFHSGDGGFTWRSGGLVNTHVSALALASDSTEEGSMEVFAATTDSGLYASSDDGSTWFPTAIKDEGISAIAATKESGGDNTLDLYLGTPFGVSTYSGNGNSWQQLWARELNGVSVYGLMCCPTSASTSAGSVFAATSGGIYRSRNNGDDWLTVNEGLTTPYVYGLVALPDGNEAGITRFAAASYGGGVFLSSDSGSSWQPINSGLGNRYVYALQAWRGTLFAGTYDGIYSTTNSGTTWSDVSEGLSSRFVFSLAASDSCLFAGTYRGGIWRRAVSEMLTSAPSADQRALSSILLEQSYPNPFNASTTIRYTLNARMHVTLTVYNILGQRIATLVNDELRQGPHQVTFSGNDLASGIYMYCLRAGGLTLTRHFILLR